MSPCSTARGLHLPCAAAVMCCARTAARSLLRLVSCLSQLEAHSHKQCKTVLQESDSKAQEDQLVRDDRNLSGGASIEDAMSELNQSLLAQVAERPTSGRKRVDKPDEQTESRNWRMPREAPTQPANDFGRRLTQKEIAARYARMRDIIEQDNKRKESPHRSNGVDALYTAEGSYAQADSDTDITRPQESEKSSARSTADRQAFAAEPPPASGYDVAADADVAMPFSGAVALAGLILAGVRLGRGTANAERLGGRQIDELLSERLRRNAQAQEAAADGAGASQRVQDAKAKVQLESWCRSTFVHLT